ncbi:MAG: response regulator transcription factor [Chitinophagales bacterium]|nr:response regulator transcription factor [Chitinophagaceae bacterium]MCB9066009.1 response regulator transcription factor [Chitinophagales bacterium]
MNIMLLEDEPLVAESLLKLVRQLEPGANIVGPVESVKEARMKLEMQTPDLIISDIQLADGISLDVFVDYNIQCPIIFTTAFNEYAIRAFKVNSIDYLLKPIDKNELKAALDKFHLLQSKFGNPLYLKQITDLFENFEGSKKYKERFTVHLGRNVVLVPAEEVVCFSKEEVIYLVHSDGKKYITDYRSLDEIEELLNPEQFYRANRQHIISMQYIGSMHTDETSKIHLKMKLPECEDILISKEKAASFRKWIEG